ncbi:unannotated protein [freshwater metagenome]|uniref:Unannotated protein n=1 Tax=freshwater metagenome TaxID=449393 RepID=A0A6J6HST1_9ZZZZ
MRVLTGAVDVGQSQCREIGAVQCPEGVEIIVDDLLGHPVGRDGSLRMRLVDGKCFRGGFAIDGSAAGGHDDLAGSTFARRFDHVQRTHHVHVGIEERSCDRHPNIGLRGKVEHHFRRMLGKDLEEAGIADVDVMHREAVPEIAARTFEIRSLSAPHVVDNGHAVAFGQKSVDKSRADESGSAGDESVHIRILRGRVRLRGGHRRGRLGSFRRPCNRAPRIQRQPRLRHR